MELLKGDSFKAVMIEEKFESERYKINRKHFHTKNNWPGCLFWLQFKLLIDLVFESVSSERHSAGLLLSGHSSFSVM